MSLAAEYGRYGYRRITALLRAKGWRVNAKRVECIWRREGLKVARRLGSDDVLQIPTNLFVGAGHRGPSAPTTGRSSWRRKCAAGSAELG